MIEITDLHKSFGERAILRGINLSCPKVDDRDPRRLGRWGACS